MITGIVPEGITRSGSYIGGHGVLNRITAFHVANVTGTSFQLAVAVPSGANIRTVRICVITALTAGETWDAALSGGLTTSLVTAGAVAKNTKATILLNPNTASTVTTNTTNITITKNGGGAFTTLGAMTALVEYEFTKDVPSA